MTAVKNCPACKKEVPLLAVRCKYCGFKLPRGDGSTTSPLSGKQKRAPKTTMAQKFTQPIATLKKDEAEFQDKWSAPAEQPEKKLGRKPAVSIGSVAVSKNDGQGQQRKTVMGIGAGNTKTDDKQSKTLPPVPLPGQKGGSKPGSMPPPPPPVSGNVTRDLTGDADEWIPEIGDTSTVITLDGDSDSTSEISLGDLTALTTLDKIRHKATTGREQVVRKLGLLGPRIQRGISVFGAGLRLGGQKAVAHLLPMGRLVWAWLCKAALGAAAANWIDRLPPKLACRIRQVRRWHVGAALLGLFFVIILWPTRDAPVAPVEKPLELVNTAELPTGERGIAQKKHTRAPESAHRAESGKTANPAQLSSVRSFSVTECTPLAVYPDFLGKTQIGAVLAFLGNTKICELSGEPRDRILEALAGERVSQSTTVDGLPGAARVDVSLAGDQEEGDATLSFMFISDKLLSISVVSSSSLPPPLDLTELAKVLDLRQKRGREPSGERFAWVEDGGWRVTVINGRTHTTLRFVGVVPFSKIEESWSRYQQGEILLDKGSALLERGRGGAALSVFEQAIKVNPDFQAARLGRARALLLIEHFSEAQKEAAPLAAAENIAAAVAAGASGVLAQVALYNHNVARALKHRKRQVALWPDSLEGKRAVAELETGVYDPARVALTAARMSCLKKKNHTPEGVLALGNFPDTKSFFAAVEKASRDASFDATKRRFVKVQCR